MLKRFCYYYCLLFLMISPGRYYIKSVDLYWYIVNKQYGLVFARFRVQSDQYFPGFSYFAGLFHEPLGE